jgi:hypothetical protein
MSHKDCLQPACVFVLASQFSQRRIDFALARRRSGIFKAFCQKDLDFLINNFSCRQTKRLKLMVEICVAVMESVGMFMEN